ncbi:HD domain-containing protein [Nocardiopsis changdeensis]|uniref:5'-deoxynucleotidase n=1 Tax=Nocardiopsis changdeensis TaxID=2831969 RepID=A0ABX8BLM0_9ACTN|nr:MULTISPECIES: HD domain-containing protein [Nocardiopsis]QKW31710.1 HD domain-containing protein [Nocardiopsis flavescens]QUX22944.1 HD domain-containing protein [Nocardiopsis changdeensis]QYX38887.1 HD domain-containing protein [Nocardiopsis sp. MT53]
MTEPAPVFASGVDNERLNAQLRFLLEVDKLKRILRQNLLVDGSRRENSAEHSWHLALTARTFAEYAPEGTDIDRVVEMLVLHDIVEIDAGDTFLFDQVNSQTQAERERAAADRIFPLLPEDQAEAARALWEEFEARVTPEARFARAVDRLSPMLANWHNEGGTWVRFGITRAQVMEKVKLIAEGSEALGAYATALIDDADRRGYFRT